AGAGAEGAQGGCGGGRPRVGGHGWGGGRRRRRPPEDEPMQAVFKPVLGRVAGLGSSLWLWPEIAYRVRSAELQRNQVVDLVGIVDLVEQPVLGEYLVSDFFRHAAVRLCPPRCAYL